MNRVDLLEQAGWALSAGCKAAPQLPNSVDIRKFWLLSSGQKAGTSQDHTSAAHISSCDTNMLR